MSFGSALVGDVVFIVVVLADDGSPGAAYGPFDDRESAEGWGTPPGVVGDTRVMPMHEPVVWNA